MSTPRSIRLDAAAPIPFPHEQQHARLRDESGDDVLEEFEAMSRRIENLARELNCLGYFDDEDRPKAA